MPVEVRNLEIEELEKLQAKEKYLTKGDIVCDCGNKWHFETLGYFVTCGKCRKTQKAIGEKVLYQPEIIEEETEQ